LSLEELRAVGVVIVIEGDPSLTDDNEGPRYPLRLDSLESWSNHRITARLPKWLLLSVQPATHDNPERALVWVSDGYRSAFLKLFEEYLTKVTPLGRPQNQPLVANIARIRTAVLRDLWQSSGEPPAGERLWWELWLHKTAEGFDYLRQYAEALGLGVSGRRLILDTRAVVWVNARWEDLLALPFTAVPLAEIRRPQFIDTVEDLDTDDQEILVTDLGKRIKPASNGSPAVCLLDSGVRRTHSLLESSLDEADLHSVVGLPLGDVRGHGTQMAGLALYGPLDDPLLSSDAVDLWHRIESVKLLPDPGIPARDPETYGLATAEAVALPETTIQRRRVYCLPLTAHADLAGQPSLWSASIDALAVGTDIGRSDDGIELLGAPDPAASRLILVSAGNVDAYQADYRQGCDLSPIEDPAQAWNALTIGAYTELCDVPTDPTYAGWSALAVSGDISPHSRTGVIAGGKPWPVKPDISLEGGNVLTDGAGDFHTKHPLLGLRTTDLAHDTALASAEATSAATAQAARLAARAMAVYPSYWPETVRGLLVHAAEWTDTMRHEIEGETGKTARLSLLKRYGWGCPTDEAVLSSTANAVTLVVQDEFVPFEGDDFAMRQFRLHRLPWPSMVLADLGAADVELRVTLSYFIEPAAARRGWRRRYAYASHGLRFELKSPTETTIEEFVRRVNREAAQEEEGAVQSRGVDNWVIGPNQRNTGSLHQDIWLGSGAALANTGVLAVHAVGGWWKNNRRQDRAALPVRYALIVSLRTRAEGVDLYTPIATELDIPVEAVVIDI
jgi:hypothetical protein